MELRRTHLPYCIQRLDDGRYIMLNRNYKPLGQQTSEWITYADHPSAVLVRITAATAKKLSCKERDDVEQIFLYDDGCIPTDSTAHMDAYLKRLSVLMALKAKSD